MNACPGLTRAWQSAVAVMALFVCVPLALAQSHPDTFAGRRLEDALRAMQARGLPVIFSSELVTPDMRVKSEPRAATASGQLAELLEPHGLTPERGPGGVIQVVRRKRPPKEKARAARALPNAVDNARDDARALEPTYQELVTVFPSPHGSGNGSFGSDRSVGSNELSGLSSHIADDPLRVVQAMPGVAGGDDFRSEYSVRGSAYRHASVVVDGVVAPWLQHAAPGRGDTGTMTMLRGDMVRDATLLVGAYPRKDASQLGPQLNLALREGSRSAPRFGVGVSGTTTSFVAEGPLGRSARGSWLVGLRKSHVEWPVGRQDEQSTVFGFGDVQSKFAYDVRPDQQVGLSVVAGVSNVEREAASPLVLADGVNRASMVALSWRSVVGPRMVVTQQVSSLTHQFLNRDGERQPAGSGRNAAYGYRMDVTRLLLHSVVEGGVQVRRVRGWRHDAMVRASGTDASTADDRRGSWLERSGYASFRRSIARGVTLDAGIRVAGSTLVQAPAVDRWVRAEWAAGPQWLAHGSTGVMHQLPGVDDVTGRRAEEWTSGLGIRPERAAYADFGIGRRLSASVRWDATVFARRESDALSDPQLQPRPVDQGVTNHTDHRLSGAVHGVELRIERRNPAGLTGWVGYAYGVARYTDNIRGETFSADFDQRHAINAVGTVALPRGIRAGLTFRGGTNFPIPGYFAVRDGRPYAGDRRNQVRLPAYARLDLRAERTFHYAGRRFTVFGEAINVLNRVNVGVADGVITRDTGEALGYTERLYPRLLTAGVRFEF